ncbi:MAG TPA: hypothetical protein VGO03_21305 [Acidimicrobiia bacterium]
MRSRVVGCASALGLTLVLAACSTGGGGGSDLGSGTQPVNNRVVCGYVAQLPNSAAALQRADVRDPAQFSTVLDTAVKQYVATLDQIAPLIDPKLKSTVSNVRKLVVAHEFAQANDARVPLDTWTADHC